MIYNKGPFEHRQKEDSMHQRVPLKMFHPSERVKEEPLLELNQQRDREKKTEADGRNVFARRNASFYRALLPKQTTFFLITRI